MIFGRTSSGLIVPILVDSSGRVVVTYDESSRFIPTNDLLRYSNLALPAGSSTHDLATVPVGETWQVDVAAVRYTGTVAGVGLVFGADNGSVLSLWNHIAPPVSIQTYFSFPNAILVAGDIIRCTVSGATLNDDLLLTAMIRKL